MRKIYYAYMTQTISLTMCFQAIDSKCHVTKFLLKQPLLNLMKSLKFFTACTLFTAFAVSLTGCATPQERAITAYCQAEGLRVLPPQSTTQQVVRSFWIGDRFIGFRNRCRTVTSDGKDAKGNPIVIKETLCHDYPIYQPFYQDRWVTELVDLNMPQRHVMERACFAESLGRGMFSNAK